MKSSAELSVSPGRYRSRFLSGVTARPTAHHLSLVCFHQHRNGVDLSLLPQSIL